MSCWRCFWPQALSNSGPADKGPTVFAAASLKNALDAVAGDWAAKDRPRGRDFLCGDVGAREADRAGGRGRRLHLRRSGLDGLCRRAASDRSGEPLQSSRQPACLDRARRTPSSRRTIEPGFPLAELLGDGRLAIAGVDAVPAGKYGKAALQSLGRLGSGQGPSWRSRRMSAPRCASFPAARRRSGSSMRATPRLIPM